MGFRWNRNYTHLYHYQIEGMVAPLTARRNAIISLPVSPTILSRRSGPLRIVDVTDVVVVRIPLADVDAAVGPHFHDLVDQVVVHGDVCV